MKMKNGTTRLAYKAEHVVDLETDVIVAARIHQATLGDTQTLPGSDARFEGGFGVYDAPEPWGPWTTVFYTDRWDVGPGETSSFPTKWMSPDGTTVHLVFSGDDAFSVRQARIIRR